jgi:hypothetical protein
VKATHGDELRKRHAEVWKERQAKLEEGFEERIKSIKAEHGENVRMEKEGEFREREEEIKRVV